jgi:hypothetical protein
MSHKESPWFKNPDWHMVWITILLFVVGVYTAYIFHRQFKEMQTQTAILNSQAQQSASDSVEAAHRVERQLAIAKQQAKAAQDSVSAVSGQVRVAKQQLELSERPWIKVKNSIVSPLTFDVGGRAGGVPVAMMTVEDTIENVG